MATEIVDDARDRGGRPRSPHSSEHGPQRFLETDAGGSPGRARTGLTYTSTQSEIGSTPTLDASTSTSTPQRSQVRRDTAPRTVTLLIPLSPCLSQTTRSAQRPR